MSSDLPYVAQKMHEVPPACIAQAAQRFALHESLLHAVLLVEGGKVGHVSRNKNGTYDMGPMQINSIWLPIFSNYISETEIIQDPCTNVHVGAWILRASINQAKDFWHGVGNYHSATPKHHNKYIHQVYKVAQRIQYYGCTRTEC